MSIWGLALLVLSQDLAPPLVVDAHEFSFRPPAGWTGRVARSPSVVRYFRAGADGKAGAELLLTHLQNGIPTPPVAWAAEVGAAVKRKHPEAKVVDDRTMEIHGRPARLLAWTEEGVRHLKLGILRTNQEWYVFDASYPEDEDAQVRPLLDASVATFRIQPAPLSADERAALARTLPRMRKAALDPVLKGERWYAVLLNGRRIGHQRVKVDESGGRVTFESDTSVELVEGQRDVAAVRGSFSPDARFQKVESEQVRQDPAGKATYRASAQVESGRLSVRRDMNGVVEEKGFPVEEGVLLADVVEVYRSFIAEEGKGAYFIRTIGSFADETRTELLEVTDLEKLKYDGIDHPVITVLSTIDRRRTLTNSYGLDRRLLRMGGPNDPLVMKATSKEDALEGKPPAK